MVTRHTYFKYQHGYVNIDNENIYLTETGNWEETRKLTEKRAYKKCRAKHIGGNTSLIIKIIPVIYIAAEIMSFFKSEWYTGLLVFAIFAAIIIFTGQHFDLETPHHISIPLQKIQSVEMLNTKLKIIFENADNQPDFIFIEKPEEKAIEFLLALKK